MPPLSRRQVLVGTRPAGMRGLDELFEELYAQGREPDEPGLGLELVERARSHNYIPRGAVDEFAEALLREYRQYASACACGGAIRPRARWPGAWPPGRRRCWCAPSPVPWSAWPWGWPRAAARAGPEQ